MSGLFQALQTTSNTLDAFSRSIEVESRNVSNAQSPGWAALQVSIRPAGVPGGSYDVVDVTSSSDARADAVVRSATSQSSYSQTTASQVSPVNQFFDITGATGILSALRGFSTAFANAAIDPNSPVLRSTGLAAAQNVAQAFNRTSTNLDSLRNQVDTAIQASVGQINTLSSRIAGYNARLRGNAEFDPQIDANLRTALDSLSSLVNISTSKNQDGTITVLAGGTLPLVSEDQTFALGVNSGAPAGTQLASSGGGAPPGQILGSLGGLLNVRNNVVSSLIGGNLQPGSLNTLAQGFASRVNALLSSGVTASGAAGVPLFNFDNTDASNVARTLAVAVAVTPPDLALATTGPAAQSNGIANSLATLSASTRAADQINGQSAEDLFATLAARVGQQTSDATASALLDRSAQTSAGNDRQNISGVSLDREAVLLTAGQRAYQAAARFFSILDQLTQTEVDLIK